MHAQTSFSMMLDWLICTFCYITHAVVLICTFCYVNHVFQICDALRPALDQFFPLESGVRIIAEPGTYFVHSAYTIAVNVIGKKCETMDVVEG